MTMITDPPATALCGRCGQPTADGITHPDCGALCEVCAELRYDAYLDWYDSR